MKFGWMALLVIVAGCSKPEAPSGERPSGTAGASASTEMSSLYEQLHSGLFQADAAVKKLSDAVDMATDLQQKAKGELAGQLKDMVATLDDAGGSLADEVEVDPPTQDAVSKAGQAFEKKRQKLVDLANDTLHDLRDQEAAAYDLTQTGPSELKAAAKKLDEKLNGAIDDLRGALQALGGKEDVPQEPPDTADTNQAAALGYGSGVRGGR